MDTFWTPTLLVLAQFAQLDAQIALILVGFAMFVTLLVTLSPTESTANATQDITWMLSPVFHASKAAVFAQEHPLAQLATQPPIGSPRELHVDVPMDTSWTTQSVKNAQLDVLCVCLSLELAVIAIQQVTIWVMELHADALMDIITTQLPLPAKLALLGAAFALSTLESALHATLLHILFLLESLVHVVLDITWTLITPAHLVLTLEAHANSVLQMDAIHAEINSKSILLFVQEYAVSLDASIVSTLLSAWIADQTSQLNLTKANATAPLDTMWLVTTVFNAQLVVTTVPLPPTAHLAQQGKPSTRHQEHVSMRMLWRWPSSPWWRLSSPSWCEEPASLFYAVNHWRRSDLCT